MVRGWSNCTRAQGRLGPRSSDRIARIGAASLAAPRRATAAAALWIGFAASASAGCTAGYIVDSNGNVADVGTNTYVSFVQVDATGNPIFVNGQAVHVTCHTGGAQAIFSCDPLGPSGPVTVNGIALNNMQALIPEGDYYVVVTAANKVQQDYASPIFHHSYFATCTDFYTGGSVPCAEYQMKLFNATSWVQALGTGNPAQQPPASTSNGFRVVPLIEVASPAPQGRISF
jgi:hypothetical protein